MKQIGFRNNGWKSVIIWSTKFGFLPNLMWKPFQRGTRTLKELIGVSGVERSLLEVVPEPTDIFTYDPGN